MAGYVPNEWRAIMLESLVGKTAVPAVSDLYLGLATQVPDNPLTTTLANLTEVNTAGYARVKVPDFGSATVSGAIRITTPTTFQFAAFNADQVTPILFGFLTTAASGTGAPIRYLFPLADPLRPAASRPIEITSNTMIIE